MTEQASTLGSAPDAVALTTILHAVGREIDDLGQLACGLQGSLSPLVRASAGDHQTIEAFQALDLLAQGLHAVATFLDALAPSLPVGWVGDAATAARVVTLSNLAHRLGCPGLNPPRAGSDEAGVLELFEVPDE